MTTRKEEAAAAPPQGRAMAEEEQAEKELDRDALSRVCLQHCGGVPASHGADERKPTTADLEDGSGDASSAGKCEDIKQQADHYKFAENENEFTSGEQKDDKKDSTQASKRKRGDRRGQQEQERDQHKMKCCGA